MVTDRIPHRLSRGLLRLIVPLLNSDLTETLLFLWRLSGRVFSSRSREGMYEVLDYHARLELLDPEGRQAVLHKHQTVRFLQDHIIAYQDKAWGDGDIIADYRCSPGVAVDRYRDGHRWNILISLRETRHAGDVAAFRIERTIRDGFTRSPEDFQIEINHRTQRFSLSVVFPCQRLPREVRWTELNSTRSQIMGPEHRVDLADGRREYRWVTEKPRLFETYMLRWKW